MQTNQSLGDKQAHTLIEQVAFCARMDRISKQDFDARSLEMSRQHQAMGITGLVIWERSLLMVWIEGEPLALQKTWGQFQQESAFHSLVKLLHRREQTCRIFKDWSSRSVSRQDMLELLRAAHRHANAQLHHQTKVQGLENIDLSYDALAAMAALSVLLDPGLREHYLQEPPAALSTQKVQMGA